ncbi:MAG: lamin tail domain-containing protein [Candidatus Aenigmarchaeota archaeon]|nr:lamin tail domain-containing protein [Candidatus Aenigmarchaeota archaeon]
MKISYLVIPAAILLTVGISALFVQFNPTGYFVSSSISNSSDEYASNNASSDTECPATCDDKNPCTDDWCNETSNSLCSHTPVNGISKECWGSPSTCAVNVCASGNCLSRVVKDCCGNSICEPVENCSSCVDDCGQCPIIIPATVQQTQPSTSSQTQSPSNQSVTTNQTTTATNTTSDQTTQTLSHVIVYEVQNAPNEFVELYNPTAADVNVTGWYLSYFSSSRDWNNTYRNWAFPNATILSHGKFFLINIFNTSNSDWTVLTSSGSPYSLGQISNNGSIAVFPFDPRTKTSEDAKNGRIDAVGWGNPAYVFENSPAIPPDSGSSLQRKSVTADTDNNLADFDVNGQPTPKNSTN